MTTRLRRRLISKVVHLQRDLQAYLKNLDLKQSLKGVKTIPIQDHRHLVKSFLILAECYQSLLEMEAAQ